MLLPPANKRNLFGHQVQPKTDFFDVETTAPKRAAYHNLTICVPLLQEKNVVKTTGSYAYSLERILTNVDYSGCQNSPTTYRQHSGSSP